MIGYGNEWKFWLYIWFTVSVATKCDKLMEEQGARLRLERTACKCSSTFCQVKCNVKFISRERADYNTFIKLLKPLNNIGFHIQTFYKGSNNQYRPMLLNYKDEYCAAYASDSPVLGVVLKVFGDHVNFNKPCPWPPGDYYVKDFNFGIKDFPGFIPEGRYIINISLSTSNQSNVPFVYFETYFEVKNYGITDMRIG